MRKTSGTVINLILGGVFFPDAPRMDAGEIRYYPLSEFEFKSISMKDFVTTYNKFGRDLPVSDIINQDNAEV